MEKNKGLFSFRKHPVGDFPDGKKGRKRKGGRLRRSMGFLMAAVLIFNTLPASGLAVSASEQEKGLCEHHRSHTSDCGYREAQPCTHEHGEECYKTVTECAHEHTDECYPETEATEESTGEGSATDYGAEGREPENCTHVCSEESGCITKVLDCHHEHDENCGYQEAQDCGYVCEICNGTELEDTENNAENDAENAGTDTAECICETLCTEDSINGDCPVCGADDASFLDCKGKVPEENTENQEDTGICKHHQEHDADCGYIPKSEDGEGSPCTYECRVCPIEDLIAALPEQVTEDNADDVRGQLDHILDLYRELDEGEQEEIDLSRVTKLQEALDAANAPVAAAEEINISQTPQNILTAEDGDCQGHTFTGTAQWAMIYVESGAHDVTFSGLNITGSAYVGIAPDAAMNLTIEGTNTISAGINYAGIYVPKDAILVITDGSTGKLEVSSPTDAGIGGAWTAPDDTTGDVDCGTVVINGGTITVAGGGSISASAGIGGAGGDDNPGNGGNVTINGGTVTATGGSESGGYYGGAGIGGGSNGKSGNGGTLIINGGHVTLTAGTHDPQYPTYGFGQGSGEAPTGTYELTLADASYLAEGTTLDPKGKYTINGDPTEDMIVVPELVYTGEVLDTSGIKIDDSKTGTGTYFGQTFTVNASADGWELQDLGEVVNAGEYTATFTKGDKSISKTFTVAQSGTDLTEGKVKTYNGETQTDTFTAGDTITVKATPTATGDAPQKAAARLWADPTAGQMAVYVGEKQVSIPASAGEDGTYTMTVSAADVLTLGGVEPNGDPITLTAKFVGNDNMADGAGTATVNITAVAVAEKDGKVIGYYGESNLDKAFANDGATVTLLDNITTSMHVGVDTGNLTLDLNGKTITKPASYGLYVSGSGHLTIRGNGKVICTGTSGHYPEAITSLGGTLTLESGTFIGIMYGVHVRGETSVLSVTGESVSIQCEGRGLYISQAQSVELSAGTYSSISVYTFNTLASLLAENCAYYKGSTPVLLSELEGKTELTGPVTVQACQHTAAEYTPNENDASTHTKTCLACGYTETGDCGFEKTADPTADSHTGQCPDCKRNRSGAHSFSDWAGNPVARTCTVCGYEQTAVARVEKGSTTSYVDKNGLNTVFAYNSGYEDATVTLLDDLTITDYENLPKIDIRCTLNLNGHTIRSDLSSVPTLEVIANGNVTIAGSGKIVSSKDTALKVVGTAVLEGGTFCSGGTYHGAVEVLSGNLSVTGENVVMENTGSGNGLLIYSLESVKLSAGKYSGAAGAISVSADAFTLSSLLNQEGTSRVAYYQDNATLVTEGLDGQALPSGSYTVKVCTHAYQYTHTTGATTHSQTCPACGDAKAAETCSYDAATGRCACGSTLAVTLPADLAFTYDGTAKTPAVTVTVDGTPLTEGYSVAYNNNINAGNAAAVTITGTSFTGTVTLTFSIGKATPTIAWSSTSQELTYTGQQAVIIAPTVTLENNENFGGTISYSYKKQGETDYKDGLPTDAGTYTIKAHVDAEGNYNAADSINELTLTIKKADAEITVGTAAYDVNYGDPAFTISGVTDTNPETAVQYAVTEGTDVISVSNGTVTIKNAGTATITVSLPETANYNAAANKTITVTVAKKGGYTVSEINKKYYYDRENTAEINLASLLPRDCGTVTYGEPVTSGDVTFTAKAVENSVLSYTLAKGNVNDAGTITVTVTTRNYEDITVTVKAVLTDQIPVELKEGTEVTLANTILTYGESLSGLGFNNAVFVDGDGKTVEGILAWKDAAAKPSAGTASAVWVFIPTDNAYVPVEGTAAITVNKAVPTVSAVPTVADRIYNPSVTLKGDDLTGATVTGVDGNTLKGGWNWQSADIVPTVNNNGYAAIFTPEDTTNYETVTRTITVNVAKATPYIAKSPAAAGITYGDILNASALSGGTVQYGNGAGQAEDGAGSTAAVAGTFTWKEPSAKPVVADSNVTGYTVVFTPSDTANYNPVEAKVTLTVNKAQNAPNMPGSTMDVSNSLEKVGDVSLPEGWEWQASDQDTALEVGKPVSAVAVYAGADKGNYENETVTVAITRSACDHVAGEILYTGAGEKAPTCTEDGLGHRECTKCGSVVESGIVVKAPGHTGGTATCSKRAVCTRCGQPYGDTDGSVHGDTEVRGFVAATCTAGGYTGDTYCKDCGAKTKTGNATPALGHNYTSTVTKEPTTGSEGTRTYTCTRCGHSYTESIPKLPEETHHHSYSGSVTKQPTCTDTGVRTYTCSCGDSYTETIAALGHHYQSSVTKQPTATAEGIMTYTCDRCGHSYTRPIAKLPGDDTSKPGDDTTKPGDDTTKPGDDTTKPGDTEPGGNTEETRPDTGIPFIKGEDGKTGWDVIRAEEEKAQEGSTINVDMNGSVVVPGDIFDSIKGKDITITFDMGNGILWSVDGKSITTDKAGDIDFSVKTETNAIPVDIVNNVTGERYSIQISLAYEGEFGFTAVLSIGLGKENAGYTASLYYYNESTGELEFICSDEVAEDGTVSLAFTHASDYVIAIDGEQEEESGNATEPEQPDTPDKDSTGQAEESPQTGQAWRPWWIIVVGALVVIMGIGVFFVVKKGKDGDSGQV